jgi:hypothetical protein
MSRSDGGADGDLCFAVARVMGGKMHVLCKDYYTGGLGELLLIFWSLGLELVVHIDIVLMAIPFFGVGSGVWDRCDVRGLVRLEITVLIRGVCKKCV